MPVKPMPGKNDPCNCDSGKKYRKCCGTPAKLAALREAIRKAEQQIKVGQVARARHEAQFGKVKEVVHADFKGSKFVAVGNHFSISHPERPWRTFPDFLDAFLKNTMSRDWWLAEVAKASSDQHPLVRLGEWNRELVQRRPADADGIVVMGDDGASLEYVLVAYDLYVTRHHMHFNRRIPLSANVSETAIHSKFTEQGEGVRRDVVEDRRSYLSS
ncbi:MAG: SEC-C domain-containing protein [Archangium sp.]|nr:SEC-C domain-containing protein [Archangium sp.]